MYLAIRSGQAGFTESVTDYCLQRLLMGLRRFEGRVGQVTVRLKDVSGPRGGIDKHCQVLVDVADVGQLVFNAVHSDLSRAIDRAIRRAKHGIARDVRRLKQRGGIVRRRRDSLSTIRAD